MTSDQLVSESAESSPAASDIPILAPSALDIPLAPGLKKIEPYWHPYRTYAKERWRNREILELVSTEFRDRSVEYYRFALESGVTTINGKVAKPGTIVRNGDRIENVVHRHEPPVTSIPVRIMHRDDEQEIIVVDKPGSIPVHATGRYFKNSLIEILQTDFGFKKVYTVNRLDRLTSGCMIIALSSNRAKLLCQEFLNGTVKKEYIARVCGEFPEEEVTVEKPMLTVDRQMGLNIVHPDGKHAKTVFKRLFYDPKSNTSVLHCQPWTGRSHQIRVHLQFIGYPIANDPVYSDLKVWGKNRGRGGLSLEASSVRAPPEVPASLLHLPASAITSTPTAPSPPDHADSEPGVNAETPPRVLLPREDGTDIGIASPVPLSAEAVDIITKLRRMKDEDEDNSRWRDVVFRAKASLRPSGVKEWELPGGIPSLPSTLSELETPASNNVPPPAISPEDLLEAELGAYCAECYIPLYPDPKPEKLFIYLHAWRYTTTQWSFATEMPFWAREEYVMDAVSRGEEGDITGPQDASEVGVLAEHIASVVVE